MANDSYMTLKFNSLKKLVDFVRACHVTSYELNVGKITLASHFGGGDRDLAVSYGATVIDEKQPSTPNENVAQ